VSVESAKHRIRGIRTDAFSRCADELPWIIQYGSEYGITSIAVIIPVFLCDELVQIRLEALSKGFDVH
jgi:hypothetical protein